MDVICLQEDAFFELFERIVKHMEQKHDKKSVKWIGGKEAMSMLNITSKTTLQKLRDEYKIIFSQPQKRIILYDRDSINDYIEKHVVKPFKR